MHLLRLSQINIYPIKSLGGISVSTAEAELRGLKYDRRWMLTDPEGNFLTQRSFAQMALFKTAFGKDGLEVRYRNEPGLLQIPYESQAPAGLEVKVWDDTCLAAPVSPEADSWFSARMGMPCRLVQMPATMERQVDLRYARPGDHVSFADGYPFLIIGQSSLSNLNLRLSEELPMNRFRPNFVFEGGDPFAEDTWKTFSIGHVVFHGVKPCARCAVTTIDQETGEAGKEPLKTLSLFRRKEQKVLFGQNVILSGPGGSVRVGDGIRVLEWAEGPFATV